MRRRRGFGLLLWLSAGLLAACGKTVEPAETTPAPVLPRPRPPQAGTEEAAQPAAPEVTFDEVAKTMSGTVSYSSRQGMLKVDDAGGSELYRMAVVDRDSPQAERQALEQSVAGPLRYPPERTQELTGVFVEDLAEGGNRLASLTYSTNDDPRSVADYYRDHIGRASAHPNEVTVPYGDSELVAFNTGMGTKRYRVVVMPAEGGTRIQVTQLEIAGAVTEPFQAGQGLLAEARVPSAPPPEPADAAEPAAAGS